MDEIIYLEPDEEITSVIDKIRNAKAINLGLVVPREATLLQSVVNLRLLQREAGFLHKKIAIVTTDRIGQNLASQVGIEIYNSIEEQKPHFVPPPPKPEPSEMIEIDMAQASPLSDKKELEDVPVHHFQEERRVIWERRKKPVLKPQISVEAAAVNIAEKKFHKERDLKFFKKIFWPILAVLIVLILVATYLLLPRADVIIYVPSENLQKTLDLTVSSNLKNNDFSKSAVAGNLIESSSEKQENFPTTGKKTIGDKAHGTITIYNSFDSNIHRFDAGAKVSSSGKTFLLKNGVEVPASTVQSSKIVPGSVGVEIEAENPGEDYNVKAGRFTILGLPSAEQEAIYGNSTEAMSGGLSKEVQVVSDDDFNNAKAKILNELTTTVSKDLQTKAKNQKLLETAIYKPDPEITASATVGQEAKNFDLKIKLRNQIMVFNFNDTKDLIIANLQKQVPSDKMVSIAKDEDIGLVVNKIVYDKQELDLTANVLAKISTKISAEKIQKELAGKTRENAENYIKSQLGVEREEINVWPALWLKKMPVLQRNIKIKIEYLTK